jgi:hypothetical protein
VERGRGGPLTGGAELCVRPVHRPCNSLWAHACAGCAPLRGQAEGLGLWATAARLSTPRPAWSNPGVRSFSPSTRSCWVHCRRADIRVEYGPGIELIELAGREQAPLAHPRPEDLVHQRRLAEARVPRDERQRASSQKVMPSETSTCPPRCSPGGRPGDRAGGSTRSRSR